MITGISSKLCTGTGEGSCHSSERDRHGFSGVGTRANTSEYTKFPRKTSIEAPSTKAETDTQSFRNWRWCGYVTTRRGWPMKPIAKSGAKVELNEMNIDQKWIFPSRSLSSKPVIFGIQ